MSVLSIKELNQETRAKQGSESPKGQKQSWDIAIKDESCFPKPIIQKDANKSDVARRIIRSCITTTTRNTDGFRLFI